MNGEIDNGWQVIHGYQQRIFFFVSCTSAQNAPSNPKQFTLMARWRLYNAALLLILRPHFVHYQM
jgi:hypothetical protein